MTDVEPTPTGTVHPLLRLVGGTVAKTLIVLFTLCAVFVIWALVFFLPHRQAQTDWIACAKKPIEDQGYYLRRGDLKKAEAAGKLADACGEPPT